MAGDNRKTPKDRNHSRLLQIESPPIGGAAQGSNLPSKLRPVPPSFVSFGRFHRRFTAHFSSQPDNARPATPAQPNPCNVSREGGEGREAQSDFRLETPGTVPGGIARPALVGFASFAAFAGLDLLSTTSSRLRRRGRPPGHATARGSPIEFIFAFCNREGHAKSAGTYNSRCDSCHHPALPSSP